MSSSTSATLAVIVGRKVNGHPFPPEDKRLLFVKEYLNELKRLNPAQLNQDGKETEEHLIMNVDFGVLFFSPFFFT